MVASVYEAETKAVEWATSCALGLNWNKLSFSSNANMVVKEINSSKDPVGWFTRDSVLHVRSLLLVNDWNLVWNARVFNKFADFFDKISFGW